MRRNIILFACLALATAVVARPKVGLVLSGGGAKGAAEVGVLKVIERAGIPIDYIAGTSIGSIVGGLYATGYTSAELDTLFRTQPWLSLLTDRREDLSTEPYKVINGVTYLFGFPVMVSGGDTELSGMGALRGNRIEALLDSLMGYRGYNEFGHLLTPFRCVACEFRTAGEVVLSQGSPARAMRASMAIPGVFKPVRIGGKSLVDGGMVNNLPVDVVRQMGADIIIAVDLQQDKPQNKPEKDTSFLRMMGDFIGIGGLIDWMIQRPDIRKYNDNRRHADVYINPVLPYDAASFGNRNCAAMIEIGEKAAMKHWKELQMVKEQLK